MYFQLQLQISLHCTHFDDTASFFPSTVTQDLKFHMFAKYFFDDQVTEEILILNDII